MIWHFLDIFFVVLHTSVIIFSLSGWIWKKSRKLNLVILILIGCSWLFLGIIVGTPGYCPLTEWHFNVLEKIGRTNLPDSYVKYLADRLTGKNFNASMVDSITLLSYIVVLLISTALNARDMIKKRLTARGVH
jgi:hypothetical protein